MGYHISEQAGKINHLLYMDDLKLYAKSSTEIESLLNTVQIFSEDTVVPRLTSAPFNDEFA